MLAALRIIWELGIRTVFMIGVDLNMTQTKGYAFAEGRHKGAVNNNTATYKKMMTEYFPQLKPVFDTAGFKIYNCNPDSALKTFDFLPYAEAIEMATRELGDPVAEKSEGMYVKLDEKLRLGAWDACVKATHGLIETVEEAD